LQNHYGKGCAKKQAQEGGERKKIHQKMTALQKRVVTPVKTGVQTFRNYPKTLDSGFRRNDEISRFLAFYEADK